MINARSNAQGSAQSPAKKTVGLIEKETEVSYKVGKYSFTLDAPLCGIKLLILFC